MKIILASTNRNKAVEFVNILKSEGVDIQLLMPQELYIGGMEVEEIGSTFEENALLKAEAYSKVAGMPAISDDSGLEIDYLDKRPGIYSARYAGEYSNDKKNRKKVLAELQGVEEEKRTARFRCAICYVDHEISFFATGKVEGRIIDEERGEHGFGYDSIFIPNGYDITFAEMSQEQKNEISHRKVALKNFAEEFKKKM